MSRHLEAEIVRLTDSARESAILNCGLSEPLSCKTTRCANARKLIQAEEALKVLPECEQIYLNLRGKDSQIDALVADFAARRGVAGTILGGKHRRDIRMEPKYNALDFRHGDLGIACGRIPANVVKGFPVTAFAFFAEGNGHSRRVIAGCEELVEVLPGSTAGEALRCKTCG
jgi:hypothetical protein